MKKLIRIFTDGAGQRPDGKASAIAWLREDTREQHVERIDGMTNNVAEYRAVLSALKKMSPRSNAELLTDSQLVVSQLRGEWRILDATMAKLAAEVRTITEQKKLELKVIWVPR